jgi:hypothetical protein
MAETQVPPVARLFLEIVALRLKIKLLERESAELRERLDRLESPRAV